MYVGRVGGSDAFETEIKCSIADRLPWVPEDFFCFRGKAALSGEGRGMA